VLSDVVSSVFLSYFYFFTGHVAEPPEEVRGTPGFRGTPVEKHWLSDFAHRSFDDLHV